MFNIETIVSKYVQIKSAKITIFMGGINCEFIQEIHHLIKNLIMFGIYLVSLYSLHIFPHFLDSITYSLRLIFLTKFLHNTYKHHSPGELK